MAEPACGLLLAAEAARDEAVADLGRRPGVALGIAGDCRGSELRGGERLTARAGDIGVAELRGGRLARACDRNDNCRWGILGRLLVFREEGGGEGKGGDEYDSENHKYFFAQDQFSDKDCIYFQDALGGSQMPVPISANKNLWKGGRLIGVTPCTSRKNPQN
jgi:hypothetical protein